MFLAFPGGSDGKESTCSVGDLGSIPGLGRSPAHGKGYPLQYSCLENPHGQRNLAGYSPWGHKESGMTDWLGIAQHKSASSSPPEQKACDRCVLVQWIWGGDIRGLPTLPAGGLAQLGAVPEQCVWPRAPQVSWVRLPSRAVAYLSTLRFKVVCGLCAFESLLLWTVNDWDSWPSEEKNSIRGQWWGLIAQSFCVVKFY